MDLDRNPKTSNNLREFALTGFFNTYDFNISQILQNYVKEYTELLTKVLSDERGNSVNDADYDELLKTFSSSYNTLRRSYGLKAGSIIQPIDASTNNVKLTADSVIPGFDAIKHFYRLDDNVRHPKKGENVFTTLLKRFKAVEFSDSESDKFSTIRREIDCEIDDTLIPLSYCIPMARTALDKPEDVETLNKSDIINVYTHIDKDDMYRIITIHVWNKLQGEALKSLDTSTFRTLFRSVVGEVLSYISSRTFLTEMMDSFVISTKFATSIFVSTIGSLNKYYSNVSFKGTRQYVADKMRFFAKNSPLYQAGWSEDPRTSQYAASRTYAGVLTGSRSMDFVFNSMISDIMTKNIFVAPKDQDDAMLEFLVSNSIVFMVSLASVSIGSKDFNAGIENLVGIPSRCFDGDRTHDSYEINRIFEYLESVAPDYTKVIDEFYQSVAAIISGSFTLKYVFDIKDRLYKSKNISVKDYEFVKDIMRSGVNGVEQGERYLYSVQKDTFISASDSKCCTPATDGPREWDNESEDDRQGDIKDIVNKSGLFDKFMNIRGRITGMGTVYRLVRYIASITSKMYSMRNDMENKLNVRGGPKTSYESEDTEDLKQGGWAFGNIFSKTSQNMISLFMSDTKLGVDIKPYCDKLISDAKFAAESEDEEALAEAYKGSIKLSMVVDTGNLTEDEAEVAQTTISKISDIIESAEISSNNGDFKISVGEENFQ